MVRPFLRLTFLAALVSSPARADRAEDLARIHLEALGGRERIAALAAVRAKGEVVAGGRRVRFNLVAARPDRIRLETEADGRTLVQGYDGAEPPWEFDTGTWPPRYHDMASASAKTFVADAEFDDPLVAAASRGYSLDYGGEVPVDGRPMLRVLVTRKLTGTFSLLLDAETYLINLRVETRTSAGGRPIQIATRFDDYRPVDGVLLPHRITIVVDGKATQQTMIERIEANPAITAETFSRPRVVVVPEKPGG